MGTQPAGGGTGRHFPGPAGGGHDALSRLRPHAFRRGRLPYGSYFDDELRSAIGALQRGPDQGVLPPPGGESGASAGGEISGAVIGDSHGNVTERGKHYTGRLHSPARPRGEQLLAERRR